MPVLSLTPSGTPSDIRQVPLARWSRLKPPNGRCAWGMLPSSCSISTVTAWQAMDIDTRRHLLKSMKRLHEKLPS
jgi:hypothetical protein